MTCIIGGIENGTILMGADSAGVANLDIRRRADSKVFINGEFLIGFTSSFRMGQILRFGFNPPKQKEGQDVYAYMVTDFVDATRECLKSGGYVTIESGQEHGGVFLVGYRGRLFTIFSDFQVAEVTDPYAACGCGEDIALGSLYSTKEKPMEDRIKIALEAAQEYSAGVRGPFCMLKLAR